MIPRRQLTVMSDCFYQGAGAVEEAAAFAIDGMVHPEGQDRSEQVLFVLGGKAFAHRSPVL